MHNSKTWPDNKKLTTIRNLSILSTLLLFILVVFGGIVRVTDSESTCLGWPTCLGSWAFPDTSGQLQPFLSYIHRVLSAAAGIPILLGFIITWKDFRRNRWIFIPYAVSAILYGIQVGVGAFLSQIIFAGNTGYIPSMFHMILSLAVLATLLLPTLLLFRPGVYQESSTRLQYRGSYSFASVLTGLLLMTLLISGVIISRLGHANACSEWPLCNGNLSEYGSVEWFNLFHRALVALVGMLLTWLMVKAWQSHRNQTLVLVASTAAFVLFFAQALLGVRLVNGYPLYMLALHQATAVAAWTVVALLVWSTGLSIPIEDGSLEDAEKRQPGLARDLLMLTKPVVVALLLVTTFAGMVIGARAWPSTWTMFWTLMGGFMAAGGSGAINQYIDRFDDSKMQRTQKRPIPSGRLTPGEGLAFGVGMTLTSFFIMVAFVNIIAALLTLVGIIYYVLLYSIFLKKSTVQNIVIGGGAGAIPPLVGWAAATGSLNVPSLFLFAVVFMWTPPHFWALALVRQKDYARAGVPMLPVIRGEGETRKQMLFYTIELIILTLILPIFGLGGGIYLIGAGLLGLWLFSAAWRVWKKGGNKLAWKMYRYSSMYLAFLFIVLMIDRLR